MAQEFPPEYTRAIEMADGYFAKGDYINAKASYQVALKSAPEDAYAKDRLQQSLNLIKVQMQQNALYTEKIVVADDLFRQGDLSNALVAYKSALEFLPGDTYANDRVREIEKTFADALKKEEDYKKAIAEGDKLLAAGNLQGSLAEFRKAAALKPQESYPALKSAEVEKLIGQQNAVEGSYEKAIADADLALQRKKYDEAILHLENAAKIKPDETLPKQKLAEARKLKEESDSYSSVIEQADNYYIEKDFEQAKAGYERALSIKPEDEYPKSMLDKIAIALMDIEKANKSSYEIAIARADKLYSEADYEQAMVEYRTALRFKPDETYAKQRISDINSTLSLMKSQDEAYAQTISRADQLFADKKYEEASAEYSKAIGFRAMEQYPKVKIDEIKVILSEIQNQRQIYSNLITGADKLFFADDYEEAREQYRKASDLFPKEQYPLDQIRMINEILGQRDTYIKALSDADRLLYEKKYAEALNEYKKAAALNENETYPQGRIYEIETLMAEEERIMAQKREYDSVLYVADDLFESGDYIAAMDTYKAALAILPTEGYPKLKMDEIRKIETDKVAREELEIQYASRIAEADRLMAAGDYSGAQSAYQAAIGLKPGEVYPMAKVNEISTIQADLAQKEALEKQYDEMIASADKLLAAKDYRNAGTAYQSALSIKPGEAYPSGKINEINGILQDIAAQEEIDRQYTETIANADKLLLANDYQNALAAYQAAIALKPSDKYAADKITEVLSELEDIAAKEAREKQYASLIAEADALMAAQDYAGAESAYLSALKLKPGEAYPPAKIEEIKIIQDDLAAKEALEKQYAETIASADKLLAVKDYQNALIAYQSALSMKPGEAYPSGKINEINGILQDIAAQEEIDRQYNEAIANADKLLLAKDYQNALVAYQAATSLKPSDRYAVDKITEVRSALDEIAAKEAREKQYASLIAEADALMAAQDYAGAESAYLSAQKIKPGEAYPSAKIDEINKIIQADLAAKAALEKQYAETIASADKLLAVKDYQNALIAYQSAMSMKPGEAYPSGKINEINGILQDIAAQEEIDRQYNEVIANADKLLLAKDYQNAIVAYQAAIVLKPSDKYAADKMTEAQGILNDIAAKKAEEEKKYADAIAFGDKHLANKDYENARKEYMLASSIKVTESYPQQKISEIDAIEAEIRKQKELDSKYNKAISVADGFMQHEEYTEARAAYQEALSLKPEQIYPQAQLEEISRKMEFLAQEREQSYQTAIGRADAYLAEQQYEMAKIQYERAIELKPDQDYPLDKLKLVNEEIMKKRQVVQAEYDKAIADADKYYASKLYDNAIESYRASSVLKPDEEYPKEMVRRILKMLSERSIVQINKDPLLIPNNTQHKFEFLPVPVKDRKSNYLFFRARNVSSTDYKLIVNFGKDQAKSGGFVVKVPAGADLNEYIIRISAQYKWFSDDNNWITFYPEGGDIEVSLLQISYSD